MRLRGERADGGTQIGETLDQPEAIDLQTTGTTVLDLQENRRRKLARQRRLTNALLTVDQDPRRQLCGELLNIGEVHLTSSTFLTEDEIERGAQRTARCAIGIATERAPDDLGIGAVL